MQGEPGPDGAAGEPGLPGSAVNHPPNRKTQGLICVVSQFVYFCVFRVQGVFQDFQAVQD